jgi:hypothetical protein
MLRLVNILSRTHAGLVGGLLVIAPIIGVGQLPGSKDASGIQFEPQPDRIVVRLDGRTWTEYVYGNVPRPFCFPLLGPGQVRMTRNFPMRDVPGEERDHPHHRSFWFTHGAVNGQDFWSESPKAGRIVQQAVERMEPGSTQGVLQTSNLWVAASGQTVCADRRTLTFYVPKSADQRMIDFEIVLYALDRQVVFGDTKEGSMALRVAETMPVKKGAGRILNSRGDKDVAAWGKRAEWCDYSGEISGQTMGMALFDHPANPRHPTWWHVRDYGLFAANPFGRHDFEQLSDRDAGNLAVSPGNAVTFRYRLILHRGDAQAADLARLYGEYTKANPAEKGSEYNGQR